MKKLNFISVLLACVLGACALTSCGDESGGGTLDYTVGSPYEGTHIYNVSATDEDLIKDGKTEYKVVAPATPDDYESAALGELLYFFEKATGIDLEVITDSQATYTEQANGRHCCGYIRCLF